MNYAFKFININHDAVTGAASIFSATMFALSVTIAYRQIRRTRMNQRESTARSIFNDYLKVAIQYPKFGYPGRFEELFDIDNALIDKSPEEFERYEWFLSLTVFAMKEILDIHGDDPYWVLTVKRQMSYHVRYLQWARERETNNFVVLAGERVNRVIDIVVDENKKQIVTFDVPKNNRGILQKIWSRMMIRY